MKVRRELKSILKNFCDLIEDLKYDSTPDYDKLIS